VIGVDLFGVAICLFIAASVGVEFLGIYVVLPSFCNLAVGAAFVDIV